MPTPFAAIEATVNARAIGALANATMTWATSSSADGVFRMPSAGLLGDLVQGNDPSFTGLTTAIGSIAYGTAVTVNATAYTVARNEPDGAGITLLTLQKAS